MRYDISNPKAPKMPSLGKGTECIKILLSQASKDMYEPLVPMLFPPLGVDKLAADMASLADLVHHQLPPGCKDFSDDSLNSP